MTAHVDLLYSDFDVGEGAAERAVHLADGQQQIFIITDVGRIADAGGDGEVAVCHFGEQVIHITDDILLEFLQLLNRRYIASDLGVVGFKVDLVGKMTVSEIGHDARDLQDGAHDVLFDIEDKTDEDEDHQYFQNIAHCGDELDELCLCVDVALFTLDDTVLQFDDFGGDVRNTLIIFAAVNNIDGLCIFACRGKCHGLLLKGDQFVGNGGDLVEKFELFIAQTDLLGGCHILLAVLCGVHFIPVIIVMCLITAGGKGANLVGQIAGGIAKGIGVDSQIVLILVGIIQMTVCQIDQNDGSGENHHCCDADGAQNVDHFGLADFCLHKRIPLCLLLGRKASV